MPQFKSIPALNGNRIDEFLLKRCTGKSNSSVGIRLATPGSAMAEQPHFDDAVMTTLGSAVSHISDQLVCFVEDNAIVHKNLNWNIRSFPCTSMVSLL